MRIAVPADSDDLEARVGARFGTCRYVLIVDLDSGEFEAVTSPGGSGKRGAGVQAVVLAVSKDVQAVLTGYCSPVARSHLMSNGIEVVTGVSGRVGEVVEKYKKGDLLKSLEADADRRTGDSKIDRVTLIRAIRSSVRQLTTLLPVMIGVVLLIGLLNTVVSKAVLISIFSGNAALDTLWGACFGSILAGNPINSYVIGGEFLKHGVSLFAITALIVTWVTVGVAQLPAEIAALGKRFALFRTAICFVASLPVSILTVVIFSLVTR
jgi:predicted Fe-Mo cluster-binding NifX family protein